jgi:hypothetical protein
VNDDPDKQECDTYQVASWSERPYVAHDKRRWQIDHRIVVKSYGRTGVDVRHEVRSDDPPVPEEWTELEVYEARPHGIQKFEARTEVPRS